MNNFNSPAVAKKQPSVRPAVVIEMQDRLMEIFIPYLLLFVSKGIPIILPMIVGHADDSIVRMRNYLIDARLDDATDISEQHTVTDRSLLKRLRMGSVGIVNVEAYVDRLGFG